MSKQAATRKKAPVPKPAHEKEPERKGADSDSDESEFDLDAVTARAADAFTKSVMKQIGKTEAMRVSESIRAESENSEKRLATELLSHATSVHVEPASIFARKKVKKADTAGAGWYDLPATVITPEVKRDLQVLNLRGVIDRKQKFKKGSQKMKKMPKYFEIGTVIGGPADWNNRLSKKDKGKSLAEQLLADSGQRQYRKRKFLEAQKKAQSGGRKAFQQRTKKRKPF